MTSICYLLLCHKSPAAVIAQAKALTAAGDSVVIHLDARAPAVEFDALRKGLSGSQRIAFADRVKCGWGQWSLVQATLNAAETGLNTFPDASHFYLISGDCRPIRTAAEIHDALAAGDRDYIEHNDFYASNWIKVGLKEERLVYRHWFNERTRRTWFYAALWVQQLLGLRRAVPRDLQIMIGSQWWCLRRQTLERVLRFARGRRDVVRFFRTTWIPDEIFFQSLVLHLVPQDEVRNETPTFLHFSDYGLPLVFFDDHLDFLLGQRKFFARKIAGGSAGLRPLLEERYAQGASHENGVDGHRLIGYLAGRGRHGRRYAERFWERGSRIGHRHRVLLVACKKWHVGRRYAAAAAREFNGINLGYLFDEVTAGLPELGHAADPLATRNRNRPAFLRLLFDQHQTETLVLCIDPGRIEAIEELLADPCDVRVLEIDCDIDAAYLRGHGVRAGLLADTMGGSLEKATLSALRADIIADSARLRALGGQCQVIREGAAAEVNAGALSRFLDISLPRAHTMIETLKLH